MKCDKLEKKARGSNILLNKSGMAPLTFGNVCAIDRNAGVFAINPSGIPYNELSPDDMVVIDMNLRQIDGKLNPSSDTKTHAMLYRKFQLIGGIAHAYPPLFRRIGTGNETNTGSRDHTRRPHSIQHSMHT